jgi:deoxyribonuclease V
MNLMKFVNLNGWDFSVRQAIELQKQLAGKVSAEGTVTNVRLVAGFDVSVSKSGESTAAAVVLDYPGLKVVEKVQMKGRTNFPYVPGLLSFREIPLVLQVCEKITRVPDLVLVDGQGIAHPRRFGLAAHLGLLLGIPTIGCAKSHLFGDYTDPPETAGSYSYLVDPHDNLRVGAVLRTRTAVKPLYISIGHKIALPSAIEWVLQCCNGYRLPEPTRLAHLASREIQA